MSIYSTVIRTRAYAIGKIIEAVLAADNEKLEEMLFYAYGKDHFENYEIIDETPPDTEKGE